MASLLGYVAGGTMQSVGKGLGNQIREEAKLARQKALQKDQHENNVALEGVRHENASERQDRGFTHTETMAAQNNENENARLDRTLTHREGLLSRSQQHERDLVQEERDYNENSVAPTLWLRPDTGEVTSNAYKAENAIPLVQQNKNTGTLDMMFTPAQFAKMASGQGGGKGSSGDMKMGWNDVVTKDGTTLSVYYDEKNGQAFFPVAREDGKGFVFEPIVSPDDAANLDRLAALRAEAEAAAAAAGKADPGSAGNGVPGGKPPTPGLNLGAAQRPLSMADRQSAAVGQWWDSTTAPAQQALEHMGPKHRSYTPDRLSLDPLLPPRF